VPRNTSILVQFKEPLNLETVCEDTNNNEEYCDGEDYIISDNIKIYISDDEENYLTKVKVSNVDKMSFIFTSESLLGSSAEKTWYTVDINNNLEKENGESYIFDSCASDHLNWDFQVGTFLDLTPPKVKEGGIFPYEDNGKDSKTVLSEIEKATGQIVVSNYAVLKVYEPAVINKVVSSGNSPSATADIDENYHYRLTNFSVSVIDNNQAQLYQGSQNNSLLVMTRPFVGNTVLFENYFSLTSGETPQEGYLWTVNIIPEIFADTLQVGDTVYSFSDNNNGNNIEKGSSNEDQATKITNDLINNLAIDVGVTGDIISLSAKVAGSAGNQIDLITTNTGALTITSMSGGADKQINETIEDKKDQPRNSIIQINFSEPINPLNLSGSSGDVSDTIRVVSNEGDVLDREECSFNKDCLSYNCSGGLCVGDELAGKFVLSNNFKTVEFISNNICGMNGCGEIIYCLPSNANLKVVLETSDLNDCVDSSSCSAFAPYTSCNTISLNYSVCQDQANSNYPAAKIGSSGIGDIANNSFDGNRDEKANGPINYYSENEKNATKKDGYLWTFWVSDYLIIDSPIIESIIPDISAANVNLINPVEIQFNILMMKSSLRTGSTIIKSGNDEFEHNLINLWGTNPYPLGYWVGSKNIDDINNPDGLADKTVIEIKHSLFSDSMTHYSEVGSGVKDIYQNCYKPSSGPGSVPNTPCVANDANPSCCNGEVSNTCSN
jgi:hypothetical protein